MNGFVVHTDLDLVPQNRIFFVEEKMPIKSCSIFPGGYEFLGLKSTKAGMETPEFSRFLRKAVPAI